MLLAALGALAALMVPLVARRMGAWSYKAGWV